LSVTTVTVYIVPYITDIDFPSRYDVFISDDVRVV
jgi:hypothetical protein